MSCVILHDILSVIFAEISMYIDEVGINERTWAKQTIEQEARILSAMQSRKTIEFINVEYYGINPFTLHNINI